METASLCNQDMNIYHFDYSNRFQKSQLCNSFLDPVSDSLALRCSPIRNCSPRPCNYNPCITSPCRTKRYCSYMYSPDPCDKCFYRHYMLCNDDDLKPKQNPNPICRDKIKYNNIYTSCKICHNIPCCCCSVCHVYPCKCCQICHSIPCKCCERCNCFPCKCCPRCNCPKCICCPNCKCYPCKCCPECHLTIEQCRCCKLCHKYPCICCQRCHFPNCRCCRNCNNYPCICCKRCHFPKCRCCPNCCNYPCVCCKRCHFPNCRCCPNCCNYPCVCCKRCHFPNCRCCPNCCNYPCVCCQKCHFPDCRCCHNCNCYPCICCRICHMVKCMCCQNCKTYPCHCCNGCHMPNCQCCNQCGCFPCKCKDPRCKCCIQCGCSPCKCDPRCKCCPPCDNSKSPKCPECKSNPCICCPYCHFNPCCPNAKKECVALSLNALNLMNCPLHNVNTMKHNPGCPFAPKCPHENGPKCAHSKKKNNQNNNNNSSSNNNSSINNSQNYNVDPHCHMPNNQNFPNNNGPYNNNNNYNNDGSNNSSPSNITYVYDEQNRNNIPFSGQGNNSGQNNNIPYGNNGPNYGPNNNINNNGPYNNYNNPNNNNNEEECPMSPISSAYPPNDEEGQKGNWVFCPKCNVYHRCPHPGCEHNEQKRTTTHKCIHEDENNQNDPNNNNNINFPGNNNSGMGQSGKNTGRKSKKSGVFASCPYQEELGQFVDFLGFLMEVESRIEDMKIDLARREDFNFEDLFRMFEVDGKGYIEPDDLKEGLKLLGLNPSNNDIKLLMKRFDLNQQGLLSYTDFFDMVITFEKRLRNTVQVRPPNSCCSCKSPDVFECDTLIGIKNLFKFIIQCETEINNRRKNFDSLRSKYSDVVQFLDYSRRGIINRSDLKLYLTQFNKFTNSKECDLLFIRLDKTRSGEVGIDEIENELMFIR